VALRGCLKHIKDSEQRGLRILQLLFMTIISTYSKMSIDLLPVCVLRWGSIGVWTADFVLALL
jgi:hypothetical protein